MVQTTKIRLLPQQLYSARLSDETTIFSGEANSIELAFEHIYTFYNIFRFTFLYTVSS